MRVVLLSGGGGGARFARGLQSVLAPGELTVVGNVGDDLELLGLHVSPDLDSLLYTLAGLIDRRSRVGTSRRDVERARVGGGVGRPELVPPRRSRHRLAPRRTKELRDGASLSAYDRAAWAPGRARKPPLVPATDDRLRTYVYTPAGTFPFQEWFVGRRHEDEVDAVEYRGADTARAAPGAIEALADADAILFAPSNPYLSIAPIVAVAEIRTAIAARSVCCVAVSPLVGGDAVTGPLGRMLSRMAGGTTPAHMARCHEGLIDALVIDEADAPAEAAVGLVVTRTLMTDLESERKLAEVVLEAACA